MPTFSPIITVMVEEITLIMMSFVLCCLRVVRYKEYLRLDSASLGQATTRLKF